DNSSDGESSPGEPMAERGEPMAERGEPMAERGEPMAERGEPMAERGEPMAEPERANNTERVEQPERVEDSEDSGPSPKNRPTTGAGPAGLDALGGEQGFAAAGQDAAKHDAAKHDSGESGYWTWRLFRDGYSASQIALIRRCGTDQLADDLVAAVAAGHQVNPSWLEQPDQVRRVEKAIAALQS
ncbi:MAG: hypothetical protein MI861_08730, partial [Pirellulales bacterium]|nr:hypothetical protein [Pirellulales bacterium]